MSISTMLPAGEITQIRIDQKTQTRIITQLEEKFRLFIRCNTEIVEHFGIYIVVRDASCEERERVDQSSYECALRKPFRA